MEKLYSFVIYIVLTEFGSIFFLQTIDFFLRLSDLIWIKFQSFTDSFMWKMSKLFQVKYLRFIKLSCEWFNVAIIVENDMNILIASV